MDPTRAPGAVLTTARPTPEEIDAAIRENDSMRQSSRDAHAAWQLRRAHRRSWKLFLASIAGIILVVLFAKWLGLPATPTGAP